jgi:AGCS family alanine or glycine:cation symporter
VLVPLMAIGYFVLTIVIVIMNIGLLPHVLKVIVTNAFGLEQGIGGALGVAVLNGVKRGLFSNEAGEGSAPNAAATATVSHPVKQGLIQALGVFTDTLLVCSCTAFVILISGLYETPELNGIALTQAALQSEIGNIGPIFVAVAICLFAFSSIIGNYYYGEANIRFMTSNRLVLIVFRVLSGGVLVMFGALSSLEIVWSLGDLCMALVTACNLVAILALGKYPFRLLTDYIHQKRAGIKEPVFHKKLLPEIEQELTCWD